jgi:hypothetical protein
MADLEFIQVGELAKGISENLLPESDILSGNTMQFSFENGTTTRIRFDNSHDLSWLIIEGANKGSRGQENYQATSIRDNICFVDYISGTQRATSVSLVIDLKNKVATRVVGTLPTEGQTKKDAFSRASEGMELTTVSAEFHRAAVDEPFIPDRPYHAPTVEMVGKRYQYVYSKTEAYEHIYLNDNLYTWHCLAGIEKGLADTDRCHYYKIEEKLYLFVWREKIVPTLGVVLLDWRRKRSAGKLFGYESNDFSKLSNTPVGAFSSKLNETVYPSK